MKEIVCNINAFDFSQTICVYHDGKREKTIPVVGLTELEQTITQLYLAGDINVVHLYGDVEFIDEIIKNIQKNNNIRIEVH
jgi:hypothetical protein